MRLAHYLPKALKLMDLQGQIELSFFPKESNVSQEGKTQKRLKFTWNAQTLSTVLVDFTT